MIISHNHSNLNIKPSLDIKNKTTPHKFQKTALLNFKGESDTVELYFRKDPFDYNNTAIHKQEDAIKVLNKTVKLLIEANNNLSDAKKLSKNVETKEQKDIESIKTARAYVTVKNANKNLSLINNFFKFRNDNKEKNNFLEGLTKFISKKAENLTEDIEKFQKDETLDKQEIEISIVNDENKSVKNYNMFAS